MHMEPLRVYGYLEKTRGKVFGAVRALGPGAWEREFAIGPGTIGRTLTHVMISEWYYIQRMLEREVPAYAAWPIRDEEPPALEELERLWSAQAAETRRALGVVRDWDAAHEYAVTQDDGKRMIVRSSPGEQFVQLVLHEVHHRAQVLNMLRQLGSSPLGDLDFNWQTFVRREEPG